jgi:hypothetical protein
MYPWFDLIMTKSMKILKNETTNPGIQISFILMAVDFLISTFPDSVEKYFESPGFLDYILVYSLVIDSFFDSETSERNLNVCIGNIYSTCRIEIKIIRILYFQDSNHAQN